MGMLATTGHDAPVGRKDPPRPLLPLSSTVYSPRCSLTSRTARALNSGSIFLGMTTSSWTQTGAASNLGCFTGRPVGLSLGPRPVDPPALEDERLIAAAGQSQRSQRRSCCTAPYGLRSNHGKT